MALIVLIGAQASDKMTVGKELEKRIDGKLLFNHQTIDLFANFVGYNNYSFTLSDNTRKDLFKAFIENKGNNVTSSIIFTVLISFSQAEDIEFLRDIAAIFKEGEEEVYFIELVSDLEVRLKRNKHEARLLAKPSKRDLVFSENELLTSMEKHQLISQDDQLESLFKDVYTLKIDNTYLEPEEVCQMIMDEFKLA